MSTIDILLALTSAVIILQITAIREEKKDTYLLILSTLYTVVIFIYLLIIKE